MVIIINNLHQNVDDHNIHLANMYKWERLGQLGKCSPLRGKLLARAAPVINLLLLFRFKISKSSH